VTGTPDGLLRARGVLIALAPAPYGGLETVVLGLAAGLQRAGVPVLAALTAEPDAPLPLGEALRAQGVAVAEIRAASREYGREVAVLRSLVAERQPAVIHSHGYRTDLLLGVARWRRPSVWVSTAHGFTASSRRTRLYEALQRLAWRRAERVVAVSAPLAAQLRRSGIVEHRVVTLPNVLPPQAALPRDEARRTLGLPATVRVLGWVGRLSEEKDPCLALRALAHLAEPRPLLAIVGDGPLRGELERLTVELGLEASIRLLGPQPGAGRLMHAFDGLLLSSRTEGTPMVLLEASSAGVPIIATDVGGVRAAVAGSTAWLAPSGDPSALAEALAAWAAAPSAATVATAGAPAAYDQWIEAHCRLYAEAVVTRVRGAGRGPSASAPRR
jgi:glycosyltransferase involved in cell wall biosynthesis